MMSAHGVRHSRPARLRYPHFVDETAARVTAGQVVALNLVVVAAGARWLALLVTLDYLSRALAGPRWSPLARAATVVVRVTGLAPRLVPAAPKRFAATIGGVVMAVAAVLWLADLNIAAILVTAVMVLLPALESFAGFCVGCAMYGALVRLRRVPPTACPECVAHRPVPATRP